MSAKEPVIEKKESKISELWKTEDYWAIWLGMSLLLIGCLLYFPNPPENLSENIAQYNQTLEEEAARAPFKTIAWHEAMEKMLGLKANKNAIGQWMAKLTATPHGWSTNPIQAFYKSEAEARVQSEAAIQNHEQLQTIAQQRFEEARQAEAAAEAQNFENTGLNEEAEQAIAAWQAAHIKASDAQKKNNVASYSQVPYLLMLMVLLAFFFGIGAYFMEGAFWPFAKGFVYVFLLAILAFVAGEQVTLADLGFEYAAWAIIFGLLISNTVGTPEWVKPALKTEYYIKTGLVLLGAEILFGKILSIGLPGIFVAWVVTPIVLVTTYIFGQKILKITSKTLNITICADMSVCGVSAAIATAAACRAKKEELTLAVGLSLIFTSIMMIALPAFIKAVGMPEVLGGAWIGGTIDATGAVVAAGAFLGDRALNVAATIKMIQNILIGVIAFGVAVYWATKVEKTGEAKVGAGEIWRRFPKFILGFLGASVLFSLLYALMGENAGYALIDHGVLGGFSKNFREWFFCLAFVSIGLSTNFRELSSYFKGGKPLILYVCGQLLNLGLTLLLAYIMFYIVFPEITQSI